MTTIDNLDLSGVTADGNDVQEITVDGNVVWSAGVDPLIYDGNGTSAPIEDRAESGYHARPCSIDWNDTHIHINPTFSTYPTYSYGEGSIVSTSAYDLSKYSWVEVDWASEDTESSTDHNLIVDTDQIETRSATTVKSTNRTGSFPRHIESLDVSDLTETCYVRVHASSSAGYANLHIYRIELIE